LSIQIKSNQASGFKDSGVIGCKSASNIGLIRRECLDHVAVFGEPHVRERISESYTINSSGFDFR